MKIKLPIVLLFCSFWAFAQHEFLKIPKLKNEEVSSTKYEGSGNYPAEVLYRSAHYRIDSNGFMYTDIVDRIKIYRKEESQGFLDHEISVYDDGRGNSETLSNLKATTYNWEDGKVVSTKIEKDSKFKSKEDKNYTVSKFAFQNVKDGSVVEYSYSIMTPFLGSTAPFYVEERVPSKYVEFVFDTPKYLGYNINYRGDLTPRHREVKQKTVYGGDYQIYRFGYENVPAFEEEEFVMNLKNYKTVLRAELNSTFFNNEYKSYALSWEDIRKRLYEHDDFGSQLKKQNAVNDLLPSDIKSISNKYDKAAAVLTYVQKNYSFNHEDRLFCDQSIKSLISSKVGNSAEINLFLTMLLRSVGLQANPVVLSTVDRGLLQAYMPSIHQLNFVLASFEDEGKIYLLDGTSKQSVINMMTPRAFNQYGLIMTEKEVKQINVVYPDTSETFLTVNADLSTDRSFKGHFTDRDTKLYAMLVNEHYLENQEAFAKEYKDKYKFALSNLHSGVLDNSNFETSLDFSADNFVDQIGSKLVFNPLLFLYADTHSFTQESPRRSPIEFVSSNKKHKKVTITLPEGYGFENVPKSKKFRTDDNSIQYYYVVTQEGNKLTVETSTFVLGTAFPKDYYPAFKQIFDNITKLESQVVTAAKK